MWVRLLALSCLAIYAGIVGCALNLRGTDLPEPVPIVRPTPVTRSVALEGLPMRGAGMQLQRTDWMDRYRQSIDELAALGADTVKFVVDARQENGSSSRIYLDLRMTPSVEALSDLIRYAKSKNLRVILMPIVLLDAPRGGEWRGTIKPESWNEWFDSYRNILTHFAWVAQGAGVDVFVIGSELVSSESRTDQWLRTIEQVRGVFKGKLTYSANWDHYAGIEFWEELDLVAMNSYWKLGDDNTVSVEEIKQAWQPIKAKVTAFAREKNRPLLFMEVGWCSLENAASEPWDYTKDVDLDFELQRRLYQAFFEVWHGEPTLGGYSMWEWTPDDPEQRGYTPEGKPAEMVLTEWIRKEPWKVTIGQ